MNRFLFKLARIIIPSYQTLVLAERNENLRHLLFENVENNKLTMQGKQILKTVYPVLDVKIDTTINSLQERNKKISSTTIKNQIFDFYIQDLLNATGLIVNEYDECFFDDLLYILNLQIPKYIKAQLSLSKYSWINDYNQSLTKQKPEEKSVVKNTDIENYINSMLIPHELELLYLEYLRQSYIKDFNTFVINKYFSRSILERQLRNYDETYVNILYNDIKQKINNLSLTPVNTIGKKLVVLIKENINNILPKVDKWPMAEFATDLYQHSWQGFDNDYKQDAKPVFQFVGENINLANQLLLPLKFTVEQISQHIRTSWYEFVMKIYDLYHDAELELTVRNYLVNKNIPIHNQHGKELADNGDETGDETYITYNPRKDQYRSAGFIVVREFNKNKSPVDHVLVGEAGANHNSIREENSDIFSRCKDPDDGLETMMEGYIVGKIGFIYPDLGLYNGKISMDDMTDLIKQQTGLKKIYTLPGNDQGGSITRLAKIIK